jgi:hypothetical protein
MGGLSITNRGGDGTHGSDYPSPFLFKLNPQGQAVWAKQFGGGDFFGPDNADVMDIQGGVAVNRAGDCTVVGFLSITNGLFDSFALSSAGDEDIFVARFEAEAPRLNIAASLGSITISWPTNQPGFTLESATNSGPSAFWQIVTNAQQVVGMENRMVQDISGKTSFFRLRRTP